MTNSKKKPKARQETYCSSCPSQPEFVEEKKTCHSLTSHVTPSFLHVKESRTVFDLYFLDYYNQQAKNMDYDLTPSIESYDKTPHPRCDVYSPCPKSYKYCINNKCKHSKHTDE